jgi:bifunctional non-homologous end joining protein LigD
LLGYFGAKKQLLYTGGVGTGFSAQTLGELMDRFKPLQQTDSPFHNLSNRQGRLLKAHWLKPELIAEVEFRGWTRDNMLRQAAYLGLREDKPPKEVTREKPVTKEEVASHNKAAGGSAKQSGSAKAVDLASLGVRLTHPDKVLYPDRGLTKLDLAQYYWRVAEWMLPHVANRPLVLVRCPEGQRKECFYQKHPGAGTPKHLNLVPIKEKGKTVHYVAVKNVADLVSLVQLGALEIHAWGSRIDDVERPDRLVFDLDPDTSVAWPRVVESAQQLRQYLRDLGLESFLKTTGGKGLHLVVPIMRRMDWTEASAICRRIAETAATADPQRYTFNLSKAARKGRIFIDYLRNKRGSISVAPYSTRSRPDATVSAPLNWDELDNDLHSDHFRVYNLPARLDSLRKDPWQDIFTAKQRVTAAAKKKLGM